MVACLKQGHEGRKLGGDTACHGDGAGAAFKGSHAFFEYGGGGVAKAGINVAVLLQLKEVGGLSCALENVGSRLVDGNGARAGLGVGNVPGVEHSRFKTKAAGHFPIYARRPFADASFRYTPTMAAPTESILTVRPVREEDLPEVRRIFRTAFGTFLGFPNPEEFFPDREMVFTRWRGYPGASMLAERDGQIVGSNFAHRWGSFAFFGPLTVLPEFWDKGVGRQLMKATAALFDEWGIRHASLFTFAHSPKHIALYQKYGFWPQHLTAIMGKEVARHPVEWTAYSSLDEAGRLQAKAAVRDLCGELLKGLDVTAEIDSIFDQKLGDTVLIWNGDNLSAFALCQCGEGTEGGNDTCYIKFGAARPGPGAGSAFGRLLYACEALALQHGMRQMEAGSNYGRRDAHRALLAHGYRTHFQGVLMLKPDEPGYNKPDAYVVDDLR